MLQLFIGLVVILFLGLFVMMSMSPSAESLLDSEEKHSKQS